MTIPRAPITLMACSSGQPFAERVAKHLQQPLVPVTETWFACGEGKMEINSNVRGHDVYIMQSVICSTDELSIYDRFTMLLHAVEAAALSDAQYITAVLPYYPGARQDKRKGRTREGISAGLFARLLESAGARRVMTVEIHNPAIGGMFNPSRTHLENVFLTRHLSDFLARSGFLPDVVVAPDVGGLERARLFAERMSADLAAISKERDYSHPNSVLTATLIGDVANRDVLLIDDIVDTAGSAEAAVQELKTEGARNIVLACVHPVFSDPAWERMGRLHEQAAREGWKLDVVGASTIDHPRAPCWYHTFPIEELIALVISRINLRGSVTGIHESSWQESLDLAMQAEQS